MDKKDQNLENEFDIELEEDNTEESKISIQEQIYAIDIRLQEIDAQIELYEEVLYQKDEQTIEDEELIKLKQEYKNLRAQKKLLGKETKGKWDEIPIWMFLYAVFQILFSVFVVIVPVSLSFASWIATKVTINSNFWATVLFLLIPFLSLLITGLLLIFHKNKVKKKFLIVLLSIQVVETIITILIMYA